MDSDVLKFPLILKPYCIPLMDVIPDTLESSLNVNDGYPLTVWVLISVHLNKPFMIMLL